MLLDVGQPLGGICQIAYVVEDIESSALAYTRELGAGPWFVRGPFRPLEGISAAPETPLRGSSRSPAPSAAT